MDGEVQDPREKCGVRISYCKQLRPGLVAHRCRVEPKNFFRSFEAWAGPSMRQWPNGGWRGRVRGEAGAASKVVGGALAEAGLADGA
jgi:hypothetical protein